MKKIFTLVWLFSFYLFANNQEITINNHHFTIVTEKYDLYGSKGEVMRFYRDIHDKKPLFHLILNDATGGCSSRSLEDGAYEIEGNKIKLYSFFNRQGDAYNEPYGAKIVEYEVLNSGELKRLSSRVYIEMAKRGYESSKGMRYLFEKPKTKEEKRELVEYIKEVESKYLAKFVLGDEANSLMKEVKEALKRKIKKRWSSK